MNTIIIPNIAEEAKTNCDMPLNIDELFSSVKSMNKNSSPGLDGLPTEFFTCFWDKIKTFLLDSFNYSLEVGFLSPSQCMGSITLIHKGKDLPRDDLGNYRPLSITNTDYKILTKALARRLSRALDDVISMDQSGFMKGRDIALTLRELADIIMYEKDREAQSIILALDFQKAFDTVSIDYMLKTFDHFGFGPIYKKWIHVILSNRIT